MGDLAVSIGVDAAMQGSVEAEAGSTVFHLDRLRAEREQTTEMNRGRAAPTRPR